MNDFKNYIPPENNGGSPKDNGQDKTQLNSTVDFANAIAKAMNGKSQGQLWQTILSEAERGKREGRLSNSDLDNFYNSISPMLDGFRRKKLKEVIAKLKQI